MPNCASITFPRGITFEQEKLTVSPLRLEGLIFASKVLGNGFFISKDGVTHFQLIVKSITYI